MLRLQPSLVKSSSYWFKQLAPIDIDRYIYQSTHDKFTVYFKVNALMSFIQTPMYNLADEYVIYPRCWLLN